jgi:hypothetical protein
VYTGNGGRIEMTVDDSISTSRDAEGLGAKLGLSSRETAPDRNGAFVALDLKVPDQLEMMKRAFAARDTGIWEEVDGSDDELSRAQNRLFGNDPPMEETSEFVSLIRRGKRWYVVESVEFEREIRRADKVSGEIDALVEHDALDEARALCGRSTIWGNEAARYRITNACDDVTAASASSPVP